MVALAAATVSATSHTLKRSLAAHTNKFVNVKGFGAVGDGFEDDTDAINAALNWVSGTVYHGTIFLPRGTYLISAPIELVSNTHHANIMGEPGTTIIGDFDDFLIKYNFSTVESSGSQHGVIECLNLINTSETGGGIRYGTCIAGTLRDLNITANRCMNTSINDNTWVAFETSVKNCHMRCNDHVSGSYGYAAGADGAVTNCSFTGLATGAMHFAGQGSAHFNGCSFELCDVGFYPGARPGANLNVKAFGASGNRFKDCGTAIRAVAEYFCIQGIHIEAEEGTISGDPQYGIYNTTSAYSGLYGINIEGEYEIAGYECNGAGLEAHANRGIVAGVGITNTSGAGGAEAWSKPLAPLVAEYVACSDLPTYLFPSMRARHVTAATWSGGIATLTTASAHLYLGNLNCQVSGVKVGGSTNNSYNGVFTLSGESGSTLTYTTTDPGGGASGDSPTTTAGVVSVPLNGTYADVQVGETFNITNGDTNVWGAAVTTTGAHHVKIRWNGAYWTVVGK